MRSNSFRISLTTVNTSREMNVLSSMTQRQRFTVMIEWEDDSYVSLVRFDDAGCESGR